MPSADRTDDMKELTANALNLAYIRADTDHGEQPRQRPRIANPTRDQPRRAPGFFGQQRNHHQNAQAQPVMNTALSIGMPVPPQTQPRTTPSR
jgi:hypothetical protein